MIDLFGKVRRMHPVTRPRHALHPGWPEATETLWLPTGESVHLRPLTQRDGPEWSEQRIIDEAWLRPVEPTTALPWVEAHSPESWGATFRNLRQLARQGIVVPFAIEVDGAFAGQVTIGNIQHGAVSEAWIGYWVHSAYMGHGVGTVACALGVDHAFGRIGLHRLTATFLPTNRASAAILMRNGFHEEGFLRGNLHIDGAWRDHCFVAQLREDMPGTCVGRLIESEVCRR